MTNPEFVTVHGWALHGGLFDALAARWPSARWHRFDLPGHGTARAQPWPDTIAPLLDDIADRGPTGAWIVGWSLGGLLAMQAHLRHPGAFAGLILIATTPCFVARDHWPHGVPAELLKAMALELGDHPESVIRRFLALEIRGSAQTGRELQRLRGIALQHGMPARDALLGALGHLGGTDISGELGAIDSPVLLIGGRRDRLVPIEALDAMDAALPESRRVDIPGSAHAPLLTDPDAVVAAMRSLVAEDAHGD